MGWVMEDQSTLWLLWNNHAVLNAIAYEKLLAKDDSEP
jgi:hypothetical protein